MDPIFCSFDWLKPSYLPYFSSDLDKLYHFFHTQIEFDPIKAFSIANNEVQKIDCDPYSKPTCPIWKNVANRILVTKFRLSNHRLMIEVGRHNKIPRDRRFCPFCPDLIEDEKHFLFTCPTYTHLRRRFLDPASNSIRSFQYLPHDAKLQALLSIMESDTCKFIASSMDLRTFLMSQPKNMDWEGHGSG